MSEIKESVWQQDKTGKWFLYFNTENDALSTLENNNNQEKSSQKKTNLTQDKLILGSLVMTPIGINRLVKIEKNLGTIKDKQTLTEFSFPLEKISNTFNCFINFHNEGNLNSFRLKLKVSGKVDEIFEILENIKLINRNIGKYLLIYNGIIAKEDFSFEQLNIKNNSKFLLLYEKSVKYSISRFKNISEYWSVNGIDGISFQINHNIHLIGVGLYASHNSKKIYGNVKILDGPNSNSPSIHEDNIEISPALNKQTSVYSLYFSKAVPLRANQDYSVVLESRSTASTYFGQQGLNTVEGDKGIVFTFKKIQGRNGGTNADSGNFPEFYYYNH